MRNIASIALVVAAVAILAAAGRAPFTMTGGPFTLRGSFDDAAKPLACVPDFNGDGRIDASDYSAFRDAMAAGDPRTDIAKPLGVIDAADLIAFHAAFSAGCP